MSVAAAIASPASEPILQLLGAAVRYEGCAANALDDASFVVRAGEKVALIGPSGGGKTTLLRAIEGTVSCSGGSVQTNSRAALVYQDLRLVPEQSVLANVCSGALGELPFWSGILGFPEELRARAGELLADLGLSELAGEKVGTLSGGQRQRVAIARALVSRPGILLADEPLSALDPENARRILQLFDSLREKYGFALLVSTHDPGPNPDFFDRVALVKDGTVRIVGREALFEECHYCASACPLNPDEPCQRQDRVLTARSPLAGAAKWGAGLVAAAVLLVWSFQALNFGAIQWSAMFHGLGGSTSRVIPASAAEWAALPWASLWTALLETIQMAVLGTAMGVVASLPLSILAARSGCPAAIRWPVRTLLNIVRTIPAIIWALLFVAFVGLGPVAGVFALAAYSVGYLTKFFYEALEDVDDRAARALRSLGASHLQAFFRAILPGARPALLGSCLFVFEYNIRSASVLGIVGAGGIGRDLLYFIEYRDFAAAAAGLAMILAVVIALDSLSEVWRRRLARQRGT